MMLAIPVTTHFDSIMFWAAITLPFFGFLRLGELTCNSKFNSDSHLMPEDVVFFQRPTTNHCYVHTDKRIQN